MKRCSVCHRPWNDLRAHLAFTHQEVVVMHLDPPPQPAPEPEPLWLPLAQLLLALGGLWLVAS